MSVPDLDNVIFDPAKNLTLEPPPEGCNVIGEAVPTYDNEVANGAAHDAVVPFDVSTFPCAPSDPPVCIDSVPPLKYNLSSAASSPTYTKVPSPKYSLFMVDEVEASPIFILPLPTLNLYEAFGAMPNPTVVPSSLN
jgi:hypothetical protein